MFRLCVKRLPRGLRLGVQPRAFYSRKTQRGYWPEPITQQTLSQFLEDINYFEKPREMVDIGIPFNEIGASVAPNQNQPPALKSSTGSEPTPENVDKLLENLAEEQKIPSLDYDDARVEGSHLMDMAINSGIYRDLFSEYKPDREHIKFTTDQAKSLYQFVPPYWITDQPFARAARHLAKAEPLQYFLPVINISAKFVQLPSPDNQATDTYAHSSYYGNIIPACDALVKPSIALDGQHISGLSAQERLQEKDFGNWTSGRVSLVNFGDNKDKYFSVALINLDHLHENASNLHWMVANMRPSGENKESPFDEICEYLPVHGIQGFGYSRYVFLAFQHDAKLDTENFKIRDFSLSSRKFSPATFLSAHKSINMLPVGLSWFQTTWDPTSNLIFHDYLNLKAPVYEHIQAKDEKVIDAAYPGRVPFNVFLDYARSKRNINEQVLLERLKSVDPFESYKDQYVPPKVPQTVHPDENSPSWMHQVNFKKYNKLGYWRGLRPASATLPLNNNADLDYPIRPVATSDQKPPNHHNQYDGKIRLKPTKDLKTGLPSSEHESVYVYADNPHVVAEAKRIMNSGLHSFNANDRAKKKGANQSRTS